ncbi:hypothetical protein [Methanosarcina sp.]|uniref:hypothetical protein n=1 Tax=Methanosarcina sp. TaxID=2213 RepID=UPI003BB50469
MSPVDGSTSVGHQTLGESGYSVVSDQAGLVRSSARGCACSSVPDLEGPRSRIAPVRC